MHRITGIFLALHCIDDYSEIDMNLSNGIQKFPVKILGYARYFYV
jgi:hypothetical protein